MLKKNEIIKAAKIDKFCTSNILTIKKIKLNKYITREAKNILAPGNSDIGNKFQIINHALIRTPSFNISILKRIINIKLKNNPPTAISPRLK